SPDPHRRVALFGRERPDLTDRLTGNTTVVEAAGAKLYEHASTSASVVGSGSVASGTSGIGSSPPSAKDCIDSQPGGTVSLRRPMLAFTPSSPWVSPEQPSKRTSEVSGYLKTTVIRCPSSKQAI